MPEPTALPPYTGPHPPCRKCGTADARTRYLGSIFDGESMLPESLLRECRCCGYQWHEAPRDAAAPATAATPAVEQPAPVGARSLAVV
jgi:hypothetical protein